jgi:hypothetical protein
VIVLKVCGTQHNSDTQIMSIVKDILLLFGKFTVMCRLFDQCVGCVSYCQALKL